MYHWIEDKKFLKNMRCLCSGIVNELVQDVNNDDLMDIEAHMVGSGAKNMETQNASEPIDLDYNLKILKVYGLNINKDADKIKEYIRTKFNKVLKRYGWGDCDDSTSALTTKKQQLKEGNKTKFSIDLAIVTEANDTVWYRLIHEKTGDIKKDRWYWVEGPNSKGLTDKVDWLKENNYWIEVRETYLIKKNMYLERRDKYHPSFRCYIEAVNEVYNKH